jgi:hypothetical protein
LCFCMYCLFCDVHCIVCFVLYVLFVLWRSLYCLFCVVVSIVCFVSFCVLCMCTVLLPPGGYPIAVKYIIYRVAQKQHMFMKWGICLWFLSLGLPQIKSLRSKTSYSRRSESFHLRRNCSCATRNVSKCAAELWGKAPDMCTARRTPSFRYNFP